jgi:vitamin B12 transporter
MLRLRSLARAAAAPLAWIACVPGAAAQQPIELEPIVISSSRYAEPAGQVGSAVTVIGREEIEASRAENVAELLETVPGMTVNSAGGVGGTVSASIRGAEADQTLVMIDGVRVNDPASTGSEFDFSIFSLGNVERIEIIRGPQSGVYGSDAIGGVINIITRKGEGDPHGVAEAEGGSYKTFAQRVHAAAAKDGWSMSAAASNFRTSGFSRFSGGSEDDATRKQSVVARLDYDPSPVFGLTVTAGRYELDAELDSVSLASNQDTADKTGKLLQLATATARLNLLGGDFQNKLTAFIADSHRDFFDDNGAQSAPAPIGRTSIFDGTSRGLEYQGDLAVRGVDRLVFGSKIDQQTARATDDDAKFGFQPRYDVEEVWRSAFALYSFNPADVLNLTAALRADEFGPAGTEATYRFSGSYRFPELGTKLRASYGTGAKAPTIQQRFENSGFAIGNPDLSVETSRGFDIGLDQELAGGAVTLSGTYFSSAIDDLIATEFDPVSGKLTFVNVDSAAIDGIELAAMWKAASWVTFRGAYTHLDAVDAETGLKLPRRPDDAFNLRATVLPMEGLTLTASVTYVGERFNRSGERDLLDEYVRVDLAGTYALAPDVEVFFRAENLLDAEYEEIKDFGTAGRSAYLGVRARF